MNIRSCYDESGKIDGHRKRFVEIQMVVLLEFEIGQSQRLWLRRCACLKNMLLFVRSRVGGGGGRSLFVVLYGTTKHK